ncbi:MAG: DUF1294 domain-containing protein [Arcobacteraceae bacterium]|nr:DUF1294 domain-containing protein [Arcobacteraceae bacterium]
MININFTLTYFELYILILTLSTFLLYTFDKLQALRSGINVSRVSEQTLLLIALLGGSIGAILAMMFFRHKIKKTSFLIKFGIVIVIQISLGYYLYTR